MEIVVYSLLWVMQDLYHQPYESLEPKGKGFGSRVPQPRQERSSGPDAAICRA